MCLVVAALPGTYVVELVVNDGFLDSAPDTVRVDTANSAPVADAGPDQDALVGGTVSLDGSDSSDADGDALSYRWALLSAPDGSSAMLRDTDRPVASLVPDLGGEYAAQLIVSDGELDSDPDTVLISVQAGGDESKAAPAGAAKKTPQ